MREIERLNALDTVALSAGQKLRVPVSCVEVGRWESVALTHPELARFTDRYGTADNAEAFWRAHHWY